MTGQQLIDAAGRAIGELRTGRSFSTAESADLLVALNQMLATWSAAGWAIHQSTREAFSLTGPASYTLGPTGTFATPRPIRITAAQVLASSNIPLPVRIVTAEEWAAEVEDDTATGSYAEILFPDYANPEMTIRLNPAPTGGSLILHSRKPLTAIASLATTITFPPGYEQALISNFAVMIAPEFAKQASETVIATATLSKNAIAGANGVEL